ncbi:DUF1450 domain-containing protein [Bacillus dakarensis]|uniref:DUF1450 domain-containing protein n=1 Tax=Robertmurraya dakarensis TaxID=1926278 RepID=UPI000981223D|nr:DUF1450 domain-containing protein [Bacillus dakarensis]
MKLFHKLRQKKQNVTVEFCEKNLDRFLTKENFPSYDAFLKGKNITYKEYQCQSRCEECKNSPYAIVDGEFIAAKDSEELLDHLKRLAESKN